MKKIDKLLLIMKIHNNNDNDNWWITNINNNNNNNSNRKNNNKKLIFNIIFPWRLSDNYLSIFINVFFSKRGLNLNGG